MRARTLVLTARFHEEPWIPARHRLGIENLGKGFWRITIHFGFMDAADVPAALESARHQGLEVPPFESTYFLSHERVMPGPGGDMAEWRERLFAAMSRNAGSAADYFHLPTNRVIELGAQLEI